LDLAFEASPTPLTDEEFNKSSTPAKSEIPTAIANTH